MTKRLLSAASIVLAACASTRGREPAVQVKVLNGARYTMAVRTCSPGRCSAFRSLRPGQRATFTFPWTGYSRHMVEGRDGSRVAIRVPLDFRGPGLQTVTLVPRHHPQESTRSANRRVAHKLSEVMGMRSP